MGVLFYSSFIRAMAASLHTYESRIGDFRTGSFEKLLLRLLGNGPINGTGRSQTSAYWRKKENSLTIGRHFENLRTAFGGGC